MGLVYFDSVEVSEQNKAARILPLGDEGVAVKLCSGAGICMHVHAAFGMWYVVCRHVAVMLCSGIGTYMYVHMACGMYMCMYM